MTNTNNNQARYLTVAQWTKEYSWPPLGGLRHLIFYADNNGFNSVIRRAGRRILLNEQAFFDWIERQNKNSSNPYYKEER